jgi:hypothetical protein
MSACVEIVEMNDGSLNIFQKFKASKKSSLDPARHSIPSLSDAVTIS